MADESREMIQPCVPLRRLGRDVDIISGFAFKSTSFGTSGLPLVRNRDLESARDTATSYLGPYDQRYIVNLGDILVGMDGAFRIATWRGPTALLNQRVCKLVPKQGSGINQRFLFHALQRPLEAEQRKTSGTTVVHLSARRIRALLIPDLAGRHQLVIAAVLDAIDEVIERTAAVISATECLRDALLHDLLTRGVPGWHTRWRNVSGLGTIPADWQVARLESVAEIQTGRAVNRKATQNGSLEVPYLSVANVKDGYLDLGVLKTMRVSEPEIERYRLRDGDVLFTEGGDADKLGRGTVWHGEIEPCLHQNHVFAARPHEYRLIPEFLAAYAASSFGKRYFQGAAKQTTNLASVNSTQLRRMLLPLPTFEEQGRITEILAVAKQANVAESANRERLRALKVSAADALLTGLMRGAIGMETSHA